MRSSSMSVRPRAIAAALLAAMLAFAVLFMLTAPPRGIAAGSTVKVSAVRNATLHKKILVTSKGLTLYWLSGETKTKITCTGGCASAWPPLFLKRGQHATGVTGLGAAKRPDGKMQVTYKGHPVYRYAGDSAKGDVSGEGIKTGSATWHATAVK
jgi:predicted lipoprotein with Yx(FWY)xxD motif